MPNRELTGPRLRILQVEDNETNRKIAERVLSRAGHEVISVVNGAEALERLDNEEFDIILMDRDMPVMDGIEATRRIRAMAEPLASIPILGITAVAMQVELDACIEAGMTEALAKPVESQVLRDTVARLADSAPRRGAEAVSAQSEDGHTVLVVDDTRINRIMAAKGLEKLGIASDMAEGGAEALAKVQERDYSAVLVDISMPEMDGLEFTRQFRLLEQERDRRTPVIALTGYAGESERQIYLDAGMDDALTKPMDMNDLKAALERVFDNSDSVEASTSVTAPVPVDLTRLSELLGTDDNEEIFEMLSLLTEELPNLLPPVEAAWTSRDMEGLHRAAHKAKSAATSVAAVPLAALLLDVETRATSEDWEYLGRQLKEIRNEQARVEEFCRTKSEGG